MVDAQRRSEKFIGTLFIKKEICRERIDFQFEAPPAEEAGIADHCCRVGVEGGFASMSLDYRSSIDDMIEMSMGKQQQVDFFASESGIRPLRSVEKDSAVRRFIVKTIGVERTSGEAFEPIHEKMVREMMWRFDFQGSVCKLLTFSI